MRLIGISLLVVALVLSTSIQPSQSSPDQVCGPNEEYASCGSACPDTCETIMRPDKSQFCTMQCVPGCFCKHPFVRDTVTMKCVESFQCKHPRDSSTQDASVTGGAMGATTSIAVWMAAVAAMTAAAIGANLVRAQ